MIPFHARASQTSVTTHIMNCIFLIYIKTGISIQTCIFVCVYVCEYINE